MNDENTALAIQAVQVLDRPMSLQDGVGMLPVEKQKVLLDEYDKRRKFFLKWLFSHLKEGIHYGFPPGCETTYDTEGNAINKRNGSIIKPTQWLAKPSLYKSGAKLLIDLMKLKPQYSNDLDAWKMAGEPKGSIIRKCTLVIPPENTILGEGTGAFEVGNKSMNTNAAIKMADKSAEVAAVLNGLPIVGELFTQDIEEKLAERTKGRIPNRRVALFEKIQKILVEKKSPFAETPEAFIKTSMVDVLGATQGLTSQGAIDEYEKAIDSGLIDFKTGKKTKAKIQQSLQ